MGIQQAALQALNKRGKSFILRIKQDLKAAGKDASGSLIKNTTGETKIVGSSVVFEARAPEHWKFVDEGRKKGIMPPVKPLETWIKKKGLKLMEKKSPKKKVEVQKKKRKSQKKRNQKK